MGEKPRRRPLRKLGVAVLGALVVVVGIVLIPLPGPGWLIVFGGLAILGSEFYVARRLSDWLKSRVKVVLGLDDDAAD